MKRKCYFHLTSGPEVASLELCVCVCVCVCVCFGGVSEKKQNTLVYSWFDMATFKQVANANGSFYYYLFRAQSFRLNKSQSVNFWLTFNWRLEYVCMCMCVCAVCACVFSLPAYQTTVGRRFHKFIPLSIKYSALAALLFASICLTPSLSVCLSVCLWLPLSGIQVPKLLSPPAYDLSGHILPVPDLHSQSSLGKASADWFTDAGDCGAPGRSAGSLHCFTIPQAWPVLWVSGDLVRGCSGSEAQCQRT